MLITQEYKEQISELHRERPDWGTSGKKFAGTVRGLVGDLAPMNILDYGCGKQTLAQALPEYRIKGYDPGVPGCDSPPEPHDLVICTDVLEHIEPELLDDVLDDLQRVTSKYAFIQVAILGAIQHLPDGRNAHLIIKPTKWWVQKLWERFELISCVSTKFGFQAVFSALNPQR